MLKSALLKKLSKKTTPSSEPISFSRANSIGILSIYEDALDLDELVQELETVGKSPRISRFIRKPEKDKEYMGGCFTEKDINLSGTILSSELAYFTKQNYDFLLCLDASGNNFVKYILSKTHAKHRIGLYHPNFKSQLDMMIKPDDRNTPVKEVLRYLKMIRHD